METVSMFEEDSCNPSNTPLVALPTTKIVQPPSGRPPRYCDVCITLHAILYCAADDAYLCCSCDSDVHNANPLAQRHERVKLGSNGAPLKMDRKSGVSNEFQKMKKEDSVTASAVSASSGSCGVGAGVRKKSRAVKAGKSSFHVSRHAIVKKEAACDYDTEDTYGTAVKSEPGFSQELADETCGSFGTENFMWASMGVVEPMEDDGGFMGMLESAHNNNSCGSLNLFGFHRDSQNTEGEQDVPEFSCKADEEEVQYQRNDGEHDLSNTVQQSSVTNADPWTNEVKERCGTTGNNGLKEEKVGGSEKAGRYDVESDLECAASHLNLFGGLDGFNDKMLAGCPSLRLNYEDVITAWSSKGGSRLWMEEDACVPYEMEQSDHSEPSGCMDHLTGIHTLPTGRMKEGKKESIGTEDGSASENREARVMRYKEKRRNRLFSKKVRYEVRKLNAERRPRVKGRFVKRVVE